MQHFSEQVREVLAPGVHGNIVCSVMQFPTFDSLVSSENVSAHDFYGEY